MYGCLSMNFCEKQSVAGVLHKSSSKNYPEKYGQLGEMFV